MIATAAGRTNWLLIKHRDEYATEGKGEAILEEDRSVASGRSMAEIAEGKGRAPKPFMTVKSGRGKADAVWHSNRGDAAEARAENKKTTTKATPKAAPVAAKAKGKKVAAMPDFVAPQLCSSVDRPPDADGWCHEIKFDGYRVQLRVEDGKAVLKTRKGLDWTEKFAAIAREGSALPDMLVDGEIVALNHDGAPDFSALQAAISDGKTDSLIFFAFDLLFANGEDLRRVPLADRKAQLKRVLAARGTVRRTARPQKVTRNASAMSSISKAAATPSCNRPASCRWKASSPRSCRLSISPAGPRVGPRRNAARARKSWIGGWKTTQGKFRSLMAGVYRDGHLAFVGIVGTGFGQDTVPAHHAVAEGCGVG